jgi:hypothetical protein
MVKAEGAPAANSVLGRAACLLRHRHASTTLTTHVCVCAYPADKDTDEVDNDWFLCPMKIAHHQGELVTTGFPVENRFVPQVRGDDRASTPGLQAGGRVALQSGVLWQDQLCVRPATTAVCWRQAGLGHGCLLRRVK